jgi:hypothetical protein
MNKHAIESFAFGWPVALCSSELKSRETRFKLRMAMTCDRSLWCTPIVIGLHTDRQTISLCSFKLGRQENNGCGRWMKRSVCPSPQIALHSQPLPLLPRSNGSIPISQAVKNYEITLQFRHGLFNSLSIASATAAEASKAAIRLQAASPRLCNSTERQPAFRSQG